MFSPNVSIWSCAAWLHSIIPFADSSVTFHRWVSPVPLGRVLRLARPYGQPVSQSHHRVGSPSPLAGQQGPWPLIGSDRGLTMAPALVKVAFSIMLENVTAAGKAHRSGLEGQAFTRTFLAFFLPFFFFLSLFLSVLDALSESDEGTASAAPARTAGAARPPPWDIRHLSPNLHLLLA